MLALECDWKTFLFKFLLNLKNEAFPVTLVHITGTPEFLEVCKSKLTSFFFRAREREREREHNS